MREFKNLFFAALSFGGDVFLLFLMIMAGRFLKVEQFGIFNYALALTSIFISFSDLGNDRLLTREIAKNEAKGEELVGNLLVWKCILSFAALILIFLTLEFINPSLTTKKACYLLGFATVLKSFFQTVRAIARAFEKFKTEMFLVFGDRFTLFAVGIIVLIIAPDVLNIAFAFVICRTISLFIALIVMNFNIVNIKILFNIKLIKAFQFEAIPFGIIFIAYTIYINIDTLLISAFLTKISVGLYSAAYKIVTGLEIVPLIFSAVLYPRFSKLYANDREQLKTIYNKYVDVIFLLSILISFFFAVSSNKIIYLIYGDNYTSIFFVFEILLMSILFRYQNIILTVYMGSIGMQKIRMYIGIGSILVKSIIGLILIKLIGITGAALSVVVGEVFIYISLRAALVKLKYDNSKREVSYCAILGIFLGTIILSKYEIISAASACVIFILSFTLYAIAKKIINKNHFYILSKAFEKHF